MLGSPGNFHDFLGVTFVNFGIITTEPRHPEKPEGWVGIPSYHAHGSFVFNKVKLRFLVLDRLFVDIDQQA